MASSDRVAAEEERAVDALAAPPVAADRPRDDEHVSLVEAVAALTMAAIRLLFTVRRTLAPLCWHGGALTAAGCGRHGFEGPAATGIPARRGARRLLFLPALVCGGLGQRVGRGGDLTNLFRTWTAPTPAPTTAPPTAPAVAPAPPPATQPVPAPCPFYARTRGRVPSPVEALKIRMRSRFRASPRANGAPEPTGGGVRPRRCR